MALAAAIAFAVSVGTDDDVPVVNAVAFAFLVSLCCALFWTIVAHFTIQSRTWPKARFLQVAALQAQCLELLWDFFSPAYDAGRCDIRICTTN